MHLPNTSQQNAVVAERNGAIYGESVIVHVQLKIPGWVWSSLPWSSMSLQPPLPSQHNLREVGLTGSQYLPEPAFCFWSAG